MNKTDQARDFLKTCDALLDVGDEIGAASLVACSSSGLGPVWTWEIEQIHRSPADEVEKELADELDTVLLRIANGVYDHIKSTFNIFVNTPYAWYVVLCLNKLGTKAPKELINKMIDLMNGMGGVDGRRIGMLSMLKSFLPVVSYFH